MKPGGKFYNVTDGIEKLKKEIQSAGYNIWNTGTQTKITGDYMPPYGEILNDRIVTVVEPFSRIAPDKRSKDILKLEKILNEFEWED
jgi:hypothetical protein